MWTWHQLTSVLQIFDSLLRTSLMNVKRIPAGFLQVQLLSFLLSLVPPKEISSATAEDIIKFLISKDPAGKHKLHVPS